MGERGKNIGSMGVKKEKAKIPEDQVGIIDFQGKKWADRRYFFEAFKIYPNTLDKILQGVEITRSLGRNKKPDTIFYDLDSAQLLLQKYCEGLPTDGSEEIIINEERFVPASYFYHKYNISKQQLKRFIKDKSFLLGKHPILKRDVPLYKEDDIVTDEFKEYVKIPQVYLIGGKYVDKNGDEWAPLKYFEHTYKVSHDKVVRKIKSPQIKTIVVRMPSVFKVTLYNIKNLLETPQEPKINPFTEDLPIVEDDGVYEKDGFEYVSISFLSAKYEFDFRTIKNHLKKVESMQGRGKNRKEVTLYRLDQAIVALDQYKNLPIVEDDGVYIKDNIRYASRVYLVNVFSVLYKDVNPCLISIDVVQAKNKRNQEINLYNIKQVEAELKKRGLLDKEANKQKEEEEAERKNKLDEEARKTVEEISKGETEIAKHFQAIIRVAGGAACIDVLYTFHPEYKSLPQEQVKGMLADYLGDYLLTPGGFHPADIGDVAKDLPGNLSLQEALYITLKDKCLRFYFDERRKGKRDSEKIIYGYLDYLIAETHQLQSREVDDIIERVILYYDSVLKDFHKPEQFVEALSADRGFPDINQRVNMKELAEKKKVLIADEMGLGKSASVIMAKEQLGIRCALVVMPANVHETWRRYLSDSRAQGGYFKEGQAPKVLVVENSQDIERATNEQFDYVLISQERLKKRYVKILEKIGYDMLIVDEVHKIKDIKGKRAPYLFDLAAHVKGEEQYTALLSGTPVPDRVKDIAITLKLLYPQKFTNTQDDKLVSQIIGGTIEDLRKLLLPHMQMKTLEEGIEMPALNERVITFPLGSSESNVLGVLLDDDEMRPLEKMQILQKFLLNPDAIDATPGIESTKIAETKRVLDEAFQKYDKVVMFVNNYVTDVMRGENTILTKLGLPSEIKCRLIHGENRSEREAMQQEFKNTNGKMLLMVSGQTADVGIDLSAADFVVFYNEPWTEYQRKQELGRVYRPGLKHDLESVTMIAAGTIEQGIHEHILRKYHAVQKLLRGIPNTEAEKNLLRRTEQDKQEPDVSVNPELARYYFAIWERMMQMFGSNKEVGEANFKKFLEKYGVDYAEGYLELGDRSYQANVNRVAGALIGEMAVVAKQSPDEIKIVDVASGPEMLRQHISDEYAESVISMDINKEHFKNSKNGKTIVGSMLNIPFEASSVDYVNVALALHYLDFVPKHGKFERLQSLLEVNRILKTGGKAIITNPYSMEFKNPDQFKLTVAELGFKVIDGYTDYVEVGEQYKGLVITLEKIKDVEGELTPEVVVEKLGKNKLEGFKFVKSKTHIKHQRKIITEFSINGKRKSISLGSGDRAIIQEEKEFHEMVDSLQIKYGKIVAIPKEEIIDRNLIRFKKGDKYVIVKKPIHGSGMMVSG